MDEAKVAELQKLIDAGAKVVWLNHGRSVAISRIKEIDGEMCGFNAEGTRYVDLWNVEPQDLFVVSPAFSS